MKRSEYQGAIDSANQIKTLVGKAYRFYVGNRIPKDPHEVIALAEKIRKEEALREQADKARAYIKQVGKERKQRERAARRAKLKSAYNFISGKKN